MNEIIRHINYLLVTNDCVVIPGLGAVLAHTLPAHFDNVGSQIVPPARTFSFNAALDHNDGMIVSSIARAKSISFEAARSIVTGEVETMKRQLSEMGYLNLGMAGRLDINGGSLSFTPATAADLSPDYMWFPSLKLATVAELARRRDLSRESVDIVSSRGRVVSYARRFARVAASLALLLALGLVITTPIKIENARYASLGLETFAPKAENADQSALMRLPGRSSSELTIYLHSHSDAKEIVDTAAHAQYIRSRAQLDTNSLQPASEISGDKQLRFDISDKYCLVIASLVNEKDAMDYIEKHNDRKLGVLAKDGRYRVYAATGETLRQAQTAAETLAGQYPDAWVCRR